MQSEILQINLYHGTSTVFLESILKNGLGGLNPVKEWNLINLSKEVFRLSEIHLKETELFLRSSYSFKKMTEQSKAGSFNWQHGDTYLSPSKQTASSYAINKKYGSELLSYTLEFLKELIKLKLDEIKKLQYEYRKVFSLLNINPAPLLIEVSNIPTSILVDEKGEDPQSNLNEVTELLKMENSIRELYLQQTNFRLTKPIKKPNLKVWLINPLTPNQLLHKFKLYEIVVE